MRLALAASVWRQELRLYAPGLVILITMAENGRRPMADLNDDNHSFWFPKSLGIIGLVIGSAAFGVAAAFSSTSLPFFVALSAAVITMLVGATWPWRTRKLLWLTLAIITAAHVVLLLYAPFPEEVSFGFMFTPLVVIDVLVSWQLVVTVLKLSDFGK